MFDELPCQYNLVRMIYFMMLYLGLLHVVNRGLASDDLICDTEHISEDAQALSTDSLAQASSRSNCNLQRQN